MVVPFFISHQGCPHRCVFCDQKRISGGGERIPGPEEILAKVKAYAAGALGRAVEVSFFGGSFTSLPRSDQARLLDPLQPLLGRGEIAGIRVSTRPDSVDPATASFLRSQGVGTVELGVQSMDDEVLELSERGHREEDVEKAFRSLQTEGISVGAQLMPGLPGDTEGRSLAGLERVLELGPSCLRIYPALVLSDTELASRYRSGAFEPLSLAAAVSIGKRMLLAAMRRRVPVLRIGLQPTEELSAPGVVVAGPYHPALGQLVESELYFDAASCLAERVPMGSRVVLRCHPARVSDVVGQKRRNLKRLRERYATEVASVQGTEGMPRTVVSLSWSGGEGRFDVFDLHY